MESTSVATPNLNRHFVFLSEHRMYRWVSGWVGVECVCGWGVGVFMCVRMSVCESERESACVLCVNASVCVCGYVRAGARALIYVIHLHEAMI